MYALFTSTIGEWQEAGGSAWIELVSAAGSSVTLKRIDICRGGIASGYTAGEVDIAVEVFPSEYDSSSALAGPYQGVPLNDSSPASTVVIYIDSGRIHPTWSFGLDGGSGVQSLDFSDVGGWTASNGHYIQVRLGSPFANDSSYVIYYDETATS